MTPSLEVIAPGVHTTVQDAGRVGFQDVGVPTAGPLDRIALRLANALVGNPQGAAALEILLQGPTLKVRAESVRIALVGATNGIEVKSEPARTIPAGQSVQLERDDVFRIGTVGDSLCAYLAVEGSFDIEPVLGSVSTYVRGSIGGIQGRRLQKNDAISLNRNAVDAREERALPGAYELALDQPIRVIPGPQEDYFTEDAIKTLLSSEYTISPQADRMGYRLEGPRLTHAKGYNIVSDGIVTGSIQVPGNALPIVLMVDNQTTGGYPKLATVISADIPVVGRRRPGRKIRFQAVDVREAERLRKEQETAIRAQIDSLSRAGKRIRVR
jgi:allophanate hydrolase